MSRAGHGLPELVLASASPRRRALFRAIGLDPVVAPADVDESPLAGESPGELVERLAGAKASEVAAGLDGDADRDRLVIGGDTVIGLDGVILGKPVDMDDAESMLRRLSGRDHEVLTGLALRGRLAGREVSASTVAGTRVVMRALTDAEIDWYVASGEPEGKAGAYAIQGLGSLLVERIEGSYDTVVGLPTVALDRLLTDLGIPLRELIGSGASPGRGGAVAAISGDDHR